MNYNLSLPASGSREIYQFIWSNFQGSRKVKKSFQGKIVDDSPAKGTVCMSDLDGCGAVEYMYLKSWSTWLLAIPPPRSEILTLMSSFPLTIVTLMGGTSPLS